MFKNDLCDFPINQKSRFSSFFLALSWLLLLSCSNPKEQKEVATSPTNQPEDTLSSLPEEQKSSSTSIIQYNGATDDRNKKALETFLPFSSLPALASRAIRVRDSIEVVRESQPLTDPQDSLLFMPYVNKAYEAILAYQKLMAAGPVLTDYCPGLLQLDRSTQSGDQSFRVLPKTEKSNLFSQGDFFFLGGAPFLTKRSQSDTAVFVDSQGNPETRFESSLTENGNYLLSSIYHSTNAAIPTKVTFGPPLNSYDSGPQDVNGVGSLIHTFVTRIPAFFLTEKGLVPAHLITITVKLVAEDLGCVSDQPHIEFACTNDMEAEAILGVYIPYKSQSATSCKITRQNHSQWTADVNGDGIADIACVSDMFEGIVGDTLAEVLWFINVNGSWQIIDWGKELDCT